MKLDVHNGRILFISPYDATILEKCRAVPGRSFLNAGGVKGWTFPFAELDRVLSDFPAAVHTEKFKAHLATLRKDTSNTQIPALPSAYKYLPYQEEGVRYLLSGNGQLLLDDPGLGKTLQSLAAIKYRMEVGEVQKTVVICPATVKKVWRDDAKKFFPDLKVQVLGGTSKKGRELDPDADVYVINFETFRHWAACEQVEKGGKKVDAKNPDGTYKWKNDDFGCLLEIADMGVIDEIYRIKNRKSDTAKALARFRPTFRIGATGTLIPNKPDDAWFPIDWVRPGYLGSYWDFLKRYAVLGNEFSEWAVVGWKDLQALKDTIQKVSIRRIKDRRTLPDLPDRLFEVRYVEMTAEQKRLYKHAAQNWLKHPLREDLAADSTLTVAQRLAQIANQPRSVHPEFPIITTKYELLNELVQEVDDKIIIWSTHRFDLDYLMSMFGPQAVGIFGGKTDQERSDAIDAFNTDPSVRYIVLNPQSAREGITLNSSSTMVWLNNSFNYLDWVQGLERNYRIGQDRPCTVYQFVTEDTVEEEIQKVLADKHKMSDFLTNPFGEGTLRGWVDQYK